MATDTSAALAERNKALKAAGVQDPSSLFYNKAQGTYTDKSGNLVDLGNVNDYGVVGSSNIQSGTATTDQIKDYQTSYGQPTTTTAARTASTTGSTAPRTNVYDPNKVASTQFGTAPTDTQKEAILQKLSPEDYQRQKEQESINIQKAGLEGLSSQISGASESFKNAFTELQKTMGDQLNVFQEQMDAIQKKTGMKVDLEQPGFLDAVKNIAESGVSDFSVVIGKYLEGQTPEDIRKMAQDAQKAGLAPELATSAINAYENSTLSPKEAKDYFEKQTALKKAGIAEEAPPQAKPEQPPAPNPIAGTGTPFVPEASPTDQAFTALGNITDMDSGGIMAMLGAAGYDPSTMTSAEMLQVMMFQQTLGTINDPTTTQYLQKAMDRATSSYQSALQLYGNGGTAIAEINAAIEGQDFIPTSYEGLAAKVYTQAKDLQLESIELEKKWQSDQYNAWMSEETDKRNRLEGYLKAKMYAAGAQDSSAGLSLMAMNVNAADLRLQLKQSEYMYGISKLNLESRGIMNDYANNIVKLEMDSQAALSDASGKYDDRIFEIEGMFIENEQEKRKLTLNALSDFTDKMYKIDQDKQAQQRWEFETQYKAMRDTIDDAYKLSGLTGSVYYVDENGNTVDSGVPTFEANKFSQTQWMDNQKFEWSKQNDMLDLGLDMIDRGADPSSIANALGLPAGIFSGVTSKEEYKKILESHYDQAGFWDSYVYGLSGAQMDTLQQYDGQIRKGGIMGLDPMGFTDIQQSFSALSPYIKAVTQDYDTKVGYMGGQDIHGGYDIVFNDGLVHAMTGGVVTSIIPDPNPGAKSGYGNMVMVTDPNGRVWEYAHMSNFGVKVGDVIGMGDSLGGQGSTGYSTGAHVHFALVGYNSEMAKLPTEMGGSVGFVAGQINKIISEKPTGDRTITNTQNDLISGIKSGTVDANDSEKAYQTALMLGNWELANAINEAKSGVVTSAAGVNDETLTSYAVAFKDSLSDSIVVKSQLKAAYKEQGITLTEKDLNNLYEAIKAKSANLTSQDYEIYSLQQAIESTGTFKNYFNL